MEDTSPVSVPSPLLYVWIYIIFCKLEYETPLAQIKMAKVKKVSAEIVRPLRHKVLRPSLPFESSIMDLDDHDYTFHFCVKEEFRIISVASAYHESFVELPKKDAYRLRGMATEPSEQGKGYGKMVLNGVCLLYTSPSPRDGLLSRMPSSA